MLVKGRVIDADEWAEGERKWTPESALAALIKRADRDFSGSTYRGGVRARLSAAGVSWTVGTLSGTRDVGTFVDLEDLSAYAAKWMAPEALKALKKAPKEGRLYWSDRNGRLQRLTR